MIELRQQLDKERSVRMMLEEQVRQAVGWGVGGFQSLSPFPPVPASLQRLLCARFRNGGGGPVGIEPGRFLP